MARDTTTHIQSGYTFAGAGIDYSTHYLELKQIRSKHLFQFASFFVRFYCFLDIVFVALCVAGE